MKQSSLEFPSIVIDDDERRVYSYESGTDIGVIAKEIAEHRGSQKACFRMTLPVLFAANVVREPNMRDRVLFEGEGLKKREFIRICDKFHNGGDIEASCVDPRGRKSAVEYLKYHFRPSMDHELDKGIVRVYPGRLKSDPVVAEIQFRLGNTVTAEAVSDAIGLAVETLEKELFVHFELAGSFAK